MNYDRIRLFTSIFLYVVLLTGCANSTELEINSNQNIKSSIVEDKVSNIKKVNGASGWLPYVNKVSDGEIAKGASFEILEKALEGTDFEIEVQPMVPWRRMLEQLKHNDIDIISCIYYTDERSSQYLYSEYYAIDEVSIYVKSGNEFEYNTVEDLKNKIGIIPDGGSYGEEFDNFKSNIKIREVLNKTEAIDILKIGAGDFFISSESDMNHYLIENNIDNEYVALENPLIENKVYFITGLNNPLSDYFDVINKNIIRMRESGEIDRIIEKY